MTWGRGRLQTGALAQDGIEEALFRQGDALNGSSRMRSSGSARRALRIRARRVWPLLSVMSGKLRKRRISS